jgi:hypothetical protein
MNINDSLKEMWRGWGLNNCDLQSSMSSIDLEGEISY